MRTVEVTVYPKEFLQQAIYCLRTTYESPRMTQTKQPIKQCRCVNSATTYPPKKHLKIYARQPYKFEGRQRRGTAAPKIPYVFVICSICDFSKMYVSPAKNQRLFTSSQRLLSFSRLQVYQFVNHVLHNFHRNSLFFIKFSVLISGLMENGSKKAFKINVVIVC